MFSVLWRIQGGLGEHEDSFLGIASQIVKDALVPKLLHQVPIANDSAFDRIHNAHGPIHVLGLLADAEIQSFCYFLVAHGVGGLAALVSLVGDEGRYVERGL